MAGGGINAVGVPPATPPNAVALQASISLEESLNANAPASISTSYTESYIDHFSAIQWFYACVLPSEENEASPPESCVITATGYNQANELVATQDFTYTVPLGTVAMDMSYGQFNSTFQNLAYMNITVTNNLTTAALIDNFVAELYEIPANAFFPAAPTA